MRKRNLSFDLLQYMRIRAVCNLRFLIKYVLQLFIRRHCRRQVVGQPSHHFHRPGTVAAVFDKRHKRPQRQLPAHNQAAAKHSHAHRQRFPNQLKIRIIAYHNLRLCNIQLIISLIVRQKLLNLKFFPRKCLYGTHASQVFFRHSRKLGVFFTDLLIYRIQPALQHNGSRPAYKHRQKRDKCQPDA